VPLYDYRCGSCAHEVEVLQGVNDERPVECPACSKPDLKRKISAPAFTFKGGGWYKDLYSSSGGSKASKATESESPAKAAPSKPVDSTPSSSTSK